MVSLGKLQFAYEVKLMIRSREDLGLASRIVIKAGTSVVSTPDGFPSLSRMANIVEHVARMVRSGKEVMLVTSGNRNIQTSLIEIGAVGVGRQRLSKQATLRKSMMDLMTEKETIQSIVCGEGSPGQKSYSSACAAAGQLGLMSLYETMFNQFDVTVSQLLVTAFDFASPERRRNIQHVISQLLALGIVPILNENDAVSANQGYQTFGHGFSDNDSLAAMVSAEMSAHLLVLLTDVSGVYDRPPKEPGATVIDVYTAGKSVKIGEKSLHGRGGMSAKINAALNAVDGGVLAVVIAAGNEHDVIDKVLSGQKVGTLFLHYGQSPAETSDSTKDGTSPVQPVCESAGQIATAARLGSYELQALSAQQRSLVLHAIAQALTDNVDKILTANELDIRSAAQSNLSKVLLDRLKLSAPKIATLVDGIRAIARADDPLLKVLSKTEIATDLVLEKVAVPIGVLLIIFESRPDCLPQILALALRSGNGLILKGGKEADSTNTCLHSIIVDAIHASSEGRVSKGAFQLVRSHEDIKRLLALDHLVDLVIPRGSGALVKFIQANTRIPVMGHAEGVCHIYLHSDACLSKAVKIVLDAKTGYPSACNAVECLLVHSSLVDSGLIDKLLRQLRSAGVSLFGGPEAMKSGLCEKAASSLRAEFGDLMLNVEVVSSWECAVRHINSFSSHHTDCIVTECADVAESFLRSVDSACVFHNASTRFADGYRFGLGAEVGISTGRIHTRGPVGVDGLLSSKWLLRSKGKEGHSVDMFSGEAKCEYLHNKLEL